MEPARHVTHHRTRRPVPSVRKRAALKPARLARLAPAILVVEDDRVVRNILGAIIPREFPGAALLLAENGRRGLELFREHAPEIVITDIKMPVMDGIRMAGEIRAMNADTRIVAVTAYHDDHVCLERMNEIGFHECLPKPIEFERLFAVIEKSLNDITGRR